MTRPSKRALEKAIDDLADEDDRDRLLVVLPDTGGEDTPDGDRDEIHVDREGRREVAIPNTLPSNLDRGVVPLSKDQIAALWDAMSDEIRYRERQYRERNDEPIPPILTAEP